MQAFSFKVFVLYLAEEDNYKGMLPYTEPVHRACELLFNTSFKDNQYRHTLFCMDLAKELNASPMYVNTALWVLGMRLMGK